LTPESAVPEPQPIRVSVVIVSHNRIESVRRSLRMLGDMHQVVLVDNGSNDGSASLDDEFPFVRFSRLPKNFGLTKALNVGIRASDGEYILLVHDDVCITGDMVARLADFLESHPDAGAVCPQLLNESGHPAPQVRPLPTPAFPDPPLVPAPGGTEATVECALGAAIMFRLFFLRALRHIDERYGQYGSDIELCAQVRRAAKKIVILGDVTAVHDGSESPASRGALEGDRAAGAAAFLGKHYGFMNGLLYRLKAGLAAILTLRFQVVAGAFSGQKIDGTG
jgi:GT2 family glycosyltransferase